MMRNAKNNPLASSLVLIFCGFTTLLTTLVEAKEGLIYVQLLFRHGDRAPDKFYTKDPFINSWPQGASQLTTLGIEQQYALGQYLRSRYADYLNLDTHGVSYADVYVRSTDVERAISSAQINTAAFFRPPSKPSAMAKSRRWSAPNSNLNSLWQPVPIHTVPEKQDYIMEQAECKKLDELKQNFELSPKIQAIKAERSVQALLRALSYVTGEPFAQWTLTKTFKDVADALYCEHRHNLSLPNAPDQFYDEVEALRERVWPMQFAEPTIAQLRGGCMLDTVLANMRNKIDKNLPKGTYMSDKKLVIFSGHDTTILGVIGAAGLMDRIPTKPQYTTTLFFEMYSDGMVEILYKNDISSLEAIRTVPPAVIYRAPLAEMEAKWKNVRLDEKAQKTMCEKTVKPVTPQRRLVLTRKGRKN